jgi:WD40 repeat protein
VILTSGSGSVRQFDARTGETVGEPMYPHGFDAMAGTTLHNPVNLGSYGFAAAAVTDGRVIAVAGNDDGIARMDLVSGTVYPPSADERPCTTWDVAVATLPGGQVIIAGSGHGSSVHRWDAATGERIGQRTVARDDGVSDLAVIDLPGGGQLLVCVGYNHLYQWDPLTGKLVGPKLPVERFTHILTTYTDPRGIPFVLLQTEQEQQLWRLDTGELMHDPQPGLRAVFEANGTRWTVTGDPDGSLVINPLNGAEQPE